MVTLDDSPMINKLIYRQLLTVQSEMHSLMTSTAVLALIRRTGYSKQTVEQDIMTNLNPSQCSNSEILQVNKENIQLMCPVLGSYPGNCNITNVIQTCFYMNSGL